MFRWARLFLGPGEWACEPYFSNPINYINLIYQSLFSLKEICHHVLEEEIYLVHLVDDLRDLSVDDECN